MNILCNFYNDMIYRFGITIFINAIELRFKLHYIDDIAHLLKM